MRLLRTTAIVPLILLSLGSIFAQAAARPLFMAHYMPWFQTPSYHGYWGWHWTMDHFNPNTIDSSGRRSIASHYYPLTGPYDSDDPAILEYQTLLMKVSGIDGVLVDWYGSDNAYDYGTINTSTANIFAAVKKAGLKFGIVYEDQTIKHMIDGGLISAGQAYDHGKAAMKFIWDHWANSSSYLVIGGHPVLLDFGPQYFTQGADWDTLFSSLPSSPLLFTLDNRLAPVAAGAFPWPPMWKSNASGVLTQDALNSYLTSFYQQAAGYQYLVTSAFPGFHDIYSEAGVSASLGYLDADNGATISSTMRQATAHSPGVIQLVTWNDYGEGTIIEPTREFGCQYLDTVQSMRMSIDPSFPFTPDNLSWPLRIYQDRVAYSGNATVYANLDRAYEEIVSGSSDSVEAILDGIDQLSGVAGRAELVPNGFALEQNFPNPFNPSTTIRYALPAAANVLLEVYNLLGEHVATLTSGWMGAGVHTEVFNGNRLASGIYFARLSAGGKSFVRQMALVR